MKTRIYIDGYNLYFGCLKRTHYKWLDLVKLSELLIKRSGQHSGVLHHDIPVKFLTAEISDKPAFDSSSLTDQRTYHQALTNHLGQHIEIIKGSYYIGETQCRKVEKDVSIRDSELVNVWKMEEKQSDVNVALEAVYDVVTDESIEQVVFVTNDTDILPALKKIKEHNKKIKEHNKKNKKELRAPVRIGVVIPIRENDKYRRPNKSLSNEADWTICNIKEDELEKSQLPCCVYGGRKIAIKPISWFKHSDKVAEIQEILSDKNVEGSVPRSWKWLSKKLHKADGLPELKGLPVDMLDDEDALNIIIQHVNEYAKFKINQKNKH